MELVSMVNRLQRVMPLKYWIAGGLGAVSLDIGHLIGKLTGNNLWAGYFHNTFGICVMLLVALTIGFVTVVVLSKVERGKR